MARDMKAVIRAEVDASGVVRGVDTANKALRNLGRSGAATAAATTIDASLNVLRTAVNIGNKALSAATDRASELSKISQEFNVDAANSDTMRRIREYADKKRIADAVAPGVIAANQRRGDLFSEEADRVVRDRRDISSGLAAVGSGVAMKENALNTVADEAIKLGATAADILSEIRKLVEKVAK